MIKLWCVREAKWNLGLFRVHGTFARLTRSSSTPPFRSTTWNFLVSRYVNPRATHDTDDVERHRRDVTPRQASLSVFTAVTFPPSNSINSCDDHRKLAFLFHNPPRRSAANSQNELHCNTTTGSTIYNFPLIQRYLRPLLLPSSYIRTHTHPNTHTTHRYKKNQFKLVPFPDN
jgi:hypothetical protein